MDKTKQPLTEMIEMEFEAFQDSMSDRKKQLLPWEEPLAETTTGPDSNINEL